MLKTNKKQIEIQRNRREWLEEIAEDIGFLEIHIRDRLNDFKEINFEEIEEIYNKLCPIEHELVLFYRLLKEEKTISDLNDNKISIEDACKLLDKKREDIEKILIRFRQHN